MQTRLSQKKGNQIRLRTARRSGRNDMGWSLAATLIMMLVISMFVGAMWSALLPAYTHVVSLRYRDIARDANESGIDATLAAMNTGMVVPPSGVGTTNTITSTKVEGAVPLNLTTTIRAIGSIPPTNSILYSATRPATDVFHVISTTVKTGGFNKSLTALMSPVATIVNSPFGNGPAFGVTTVNEVGLACVNGYNLPAGWNSPYQFADTTVAAGVTWQIGTTGGGVTSQYGSGSNSRSQVIAGSQFEFWQPGQPPSLPSGTVPLTYEPFTQIMGNVYSNYTDQSGANGNGYWMRNQLSDVSGGKNVPGGSTYNANVFGAANGTLLNGQGVPSGYEAGSTNTSIGIPSYTAAAPGNGSGSTTNPNWGFNAIAGTTAGNMPVPGSSNGGGAYQSLPYTGGYITAPGPGAAGALDTWNYPSPPIPSAPSAPVGSPAPATGGLGVPNTTGTWYAASPSAAVVKGTLNITNAATLPPVGGLSVPAGQTVNIPPGNYNLSSLQVVNGGKITIDPGVQGQTQMFLTPAGNGQGTSAAVYVDNNSSINTTGLSAGNGFKPGGTQGFGNGLDPNQPAVDTQHPIAETSGSCLNLTFNTNSSCNMLFAGNTRALVNAPSANVNVGYQPNPGNQNNYNPNSQNDPAAVMANDANFYGAIVAGNVSVVSDYQSGAGAYLHYDVKLKQIDSKPGQPVTFNKPLGWYDPWTFKNPGGGAPPASQWRAVSWSEQ